MHVLIGIALKSLLIAAVSLGLLRLMSHRSAAERSWVAHIGLLALVIIAIAPLVLRWNIEAPALFGHAPAVEATVQSAAPASLAPAPVSSATPVVSAAVSRSAVPNASLSSRVALSPVAAATALYALPAAILLFITFLALARLIALRARADVLVDGHWLSALARAQRRMGFKHGTALLTSNELSSPISWGLMRPVILLNNRAVEASGEAEAIIAHELAHVARMDWAKLLLARIATALFWFNPFVWLLAREAHQLREETADDAVLAADIVDTDYAQLLVGVARHECPGLLLGAHGVAPSKSSLARRVARVLDGSSVRGPVAGSFAIGVLVGAILIAAPLAALTLTPGGPRLAKPLPAAPGKAQARYAYAAAPEVPADLPRLIASGVSTSVATVAAAVSPEKAREIQEARIEAAQDAVDDAQDARQEADDARQVAAQKMAEARAKVRVAMSRMPNDRQIDELVQMKAVGVSPEYVNAMRAASSRLEAMNAANFAGLKSLGVTPDYARDLATAGLRNLDANQLAEARAVGLTGEYARALASAGMPPNLGDYIELRASGVPTSYITGIRRSGRAIPNAMKVIEMWSVGVKPGDLRALPAPPRPPHAPAVPSSDPDDDGG
jgi:beta-lactamase regulating signal transducer with metallopeptidase domain